MHVKIAYSIMLSKLRCTKILAILNLHFLNKRDSYIAVCDARPLFIVEGRDSVAVAHLALLGLKMQERISVSTNDKEQHL